MSAEYATVSIRSVCKSYVEGDSRRSVLNNVSTEFRPGAMHAVAGRSGSGKSTLLNLIAGLDLPDSGTVHVAGSQVNVIDERHRTLLRRRHIGIVFQFFNLIPSLTAAENVMIPLELNGFDDCRERANQVISQVGLGDRGDSYPSRLSGGEQQRVAIARAIAHEPAVILADEPTGNLDEHSARTVVEALAQARGRSTVIVVTHDMELARQCDCKWQLRSGALTAI